jgi:general secretion pathway protein G
MIHRHKRRSGGFTLIEVLLVLVILVVLASLAVVAYGPIQRRMRTNSAKTQVELLGHAVETYEVTVGTYPQNLEALRIAPADLPPGKWDGPYLSKDVPLDPWGQQYQYSVPGQHNTDSFDVWTISQPDGQQIGNWTQELKK